MLNSNLLYLTICCLKLMMWLRMMTLNFCPFMPLPPECWHYKRAPPTLVLCGAGNQTHDFLHATQVLYPLRYIPGPLSPFINVKHEDQPISPLSVCWVAKLWISNKNTKQCRRPTTMHQASASCPLYSLKSACISCRKVMLLNRDPTITTVAEFLTLVICLCAASLRRG